jgi:peptidoglycan/LPS O-acetylase OafA/YrhL
LVKQKTNDVMFQNRVFVWIVLATGAILLIPLIAMQFTTEVSWDETDFIVMGSLLFGSAALFVLAARRAPRRRRVLIGGMLMAAFFYLWAELAVGIFFNLGS